MKTTAMPSARRLGLVLLLIACAPLAMAAGGGPPPPPTAIRGTVYNDLNRDSIRNPDEPVLAGVTLRIYGVFDVFDGETETRTDANGVYEFVGYFFNHDVVICEVLPPTWAQTAPAMGGDDIGSCVGLDNSVNLGAVGHRPNPERAVLDVSLDGFQAFVLDGVDFGNVTTDAGIPRISTVQGTKFHDLNRNGVRDPGEPGLRGVQGWQIHVFGTTNAGAVIHNAIFTNSDGIYRFALEPGTYTLCERRLLDSRLGWAQTSPAVGAVLPGLTLADCTGQPEAGTIPLAAAGYSFTLAAGATLQGVDFGNALSAIKGVKFEDLNGNGVRDPGEPGLPDRKIYLVQDGEALQSQPGPSVLAHFRVDRHTRRPAGNPQEDFCTFITQGLPGSGRCSTLTGGRVSLVLSHGSRKAETVFNVGDQFPFQLGCVPRGIPPEGVREEDELNGVEGLAILLGSDFYIPISKYGLPQGLLPGLFAKLGITVDPRTYSPIIKAVISRECEPDPNPANTVNVFNPGILVVDAEIGFASKANKVVVASTMTNADGEYRFNLESGTYMVCEEAQPRWLQTAPVAGAGRVNCGESDVALGPRGYEVALRDPGQVVGDRDFGNVAFTSVAALGDAHLWLGLKSSEDQGTRFDVRVEFLKNGAVVASGLRRCATGLTRNPTQAEDISVAWNPFGPVSFSATDVLGVKVSTRIGTNPDDTRCSPTSSHASARGVRLYYDAASRPAHIDATVVSGVTRRLYLDSNGTACPVGGGETFATTRTLTDTTPIAAAAKCKDSSDIKFSGGNQFKEVGTWTVR